MMESSYVQVKPSLIDRETISIFSLTPKNTFFDYMIGHALLDFSVLIMIREKIEDGLKSVKLTYIEALQTMIEKQLGIIRKKVEVSGRRMKTKENVR